MTLNEFYISKKEPQPASASREMEIILLKVFQEITKKLNSGIAYEKVLDFVFEALSLIIPFDRIGIALVEGNEKSSLICLKWVKSKMPTNYLIKNYCAPLEGSSLKEILETGQPRIINDLIKYGMDHPQSNSTGLAIKEGLRSSLTCPLVANSKNVGVVFFSSRKADTYKNEDVRIFLEIANELSVIIDYGRLKNHFENNMFSDQNLRMTLHDLKSPLSVIQGFLELTQGEDWYLNLGSKEKQIFSVMQRNTNYMFELINELSELKNLDGEISKIKTEEVSLAKFCAELESNERLAAEKKDIKLNIILEPGAYEVVRFDPNKINRVLDNLLTNAFKYSKPQTQVNVAIKTERNRILFEVSDQGQGIAQNEISKLFKEFGTTSTRPTGGESSTGLGLVIAKKIIEQYGGEITVTSQVGVGSKFSFWLPIAGVS